MLIQLAGRPFDVVAYAWSAPGKGHDRALLRDGFVGVADGATPLEGQTVDPGHFAERALEALQREGTSSRPADSVWRRAITSLRPPVDDPPVSCSATVVREVSADLEFSRLGDCAAVVTLTSGEVRRFFDTRIAALDRLSRESDSPPESFRRHRNLMNTSTGYWIVADDPAAADHVEVEVLPVDEVQAFALFSDGAVSLLSSHGSLDDSTLVVAHRVPLQSEHAAR